MTGQQGIQMHQQLPVTDMHSKFSLRPHHVWKYGRHPISGR